MNFSLIELDARFWLFTGACILLVVSILAHISGKEKIALTSLLSATFLLMCFAAKLYPFLNVWDERFHALVAKNMMHHPLRPTLYDDPVVQTSYTDDWAHYHIWLHKQPLFLWQIALSFQIFGVNEFALRLPSVILVCFLVYAVYRSGKLIGNVNIGYIAALLTATSFYLIELVSGRQATEQNDVAFLAYVSLSIWCWLEYVYSKKIKWLILVGLFSGAAILCKWLVGLLCYFIWGVYSFLTNKFQIRKYWDIALALVITLLVFLPWQFYILHNYPEEAARSYAFNTLHFTMAIDGQEGDYWFHFNMMNSIFGTFALFIILPALFVFYRRVNDKKVALALIASIFFVFGFFTLAATKMPSFTCVVALPIFLAMSFLIHSITEFIRMHLNKIRIYKVVLGTLLLMLAFSRIDWNRLATRHNFGGNDQYYFKLLSHNKKVFSTLHLQHDAVLFNVHGKHYVEAMFYSDHAAYEFIPSLEQYLDLKNEKRPIAIFQLPSDTLPDFLRVDKSIQVIRDTSFVCEY